VHHAWGHGRHTIDERVLLEILGIVRKVRPAPAP
jgi:hypothetical protein